MKVAASRKSISGPVTKGKGKATTTTGRGNGSSSRTTAQDKASNSKKNSAKQQSGNGTIPSAAAAAPSSNSTRRKSGVGTGAGVKKKVTVAPKAKAAATKRPSTGGKGTTRGRRKSVENAASGTSAKGGKRRKRKAEGEDEFEDEDRMDLDEEEEAGGEEEEVGDEEEGGGKDHQQEKTKRKILEPILQPRTQRIPRHIVDDKWINLPESAQKDIIDFLGSVEKAVINSFTSEKRKMEAQIDLKKVKSKLISHLPKIPVPPVPIKEMGFNLDKLLEQNRQMEATLRPDIQQIGILEMEIEKTNQMIESKRNLLDELRRNTSKAATIRKHRASQLHPVVRVEDHEARQLAKEINLAPAKAVIDTTYDPSTDKEILALKSSMQGHLASIQANTAPLEGFKESIRNTRGAVDEVLLRMGEEVYGELMAV